MSPEQQDLVNVLEAIRSVRTDGRGRPEGWAYDCPEHFVLEHGGWFEPIGLPEEFEYGQIKRCYANSIETLLMADRLTYVEGYTLGMGIPVHHAWVTDEEGRLIDRTLPTGDDERRGREPFAGAYLGVRFPVELAYDSIVNGTGSVLDDWERGWPVFRQPWTGELSDALRELVEA